jgi:hypothetical protein
MSTSLKLSTLIPLSLQLVCHEGVTFYVQAVLKDNLGVQYGSAINLTDFGDGLFFDGSVAMPNKNALNVQYTVFTDSGYTAESDEYCGPYGDLFTLDEGAAGGVVIPTTESIFVTIEDTDDFEVTLSDPPSLDIILQDNSEITIEIEEEDAPFEVILFDNDVIDILLDEA